METNLKRRKIERVMEEGTDRLTSLPDPIIHHILSLMETKHAVQTCVLSKKWKKHWTHVHSINIDCRSFEDAYSMGFILHVLEHRKPFDLCKLRFCGRYVEWYDSYHFLKYFYRVLCYALSHSVKEIETDFNNFPSIIFDPEPTLKRGPYGIKYLPNPSGLGCLTTLRFSDVLISDKICTSYDLFSNCLNLENLYLNRCKVKGTMDELIKISAPRLVKLIISDLESVPSYSDRTKHRKVVISTPMLKLFYCDLHRIHDDTVISMVDKCPNLDKVNICMDSFSITKVRQQRKGQKRLYMLFLWEMAEDFSHARSLKLTLTFTRVKLILHRGAEAGFMVLKTAKLILHRGAKAEFMVLKTKGKDPKILSIKSRLSAKSRRVNMKSRKRKVAVLGVDRLSNLPDSIIHHILSLMETKHAVRTCVLSKKWKEHWTHVHSINIDCRNFKDTYSMRFILHILEHRKPFDLCKLRFCGRDVEWYDSYYFLRYFYRVLCYALSHSVKEIETDFNNFPSIIFDPEPTLKRGPYSIKYLPNPSGLGCLTTLRLSGVLISDKKCSSYDLLSNCLNLENLHLDRCEVKGSMVENFNVSAPRMLNLTISNLKFLNHCSAENRISKIVISAPMLKFFHFDHISIFQDTVFSMDKCPNLERVSICMDSKNISKVWVNRKDRKQNYILALMEMAEGFSQAKSLTLTLTYKWGKLKLHRGSPDAEAVIMELKEENYLWAVEY